MNSDNNILVSVIVPVYKAEKYIGACIESIIAQNFRNWELILVDDGSTDRSGEICETYAKKDSRIKVLHQCNSGVSHARNEGLKVAKGKYISFVDADDYVLSTYLSSMLEYDADIVVSGFINSYAETAQYDVRKLEAGEFIQGKGNLSEGIYRVESQFFWASPWNKLYKKELIENGNILFDETIDYGEDHLFNMEYGKQISSLICCDSSDYVYVHSKRESLTNRIVPSATMFKYILDLYKIRCEYAETLCKRDEQYRYFMNDKLSSYFWQIVFSVFQEKSSMRKKIQQIKVMLKTVQNNIVFDTQYVLPRTYKVLRSLYSFLPAGIATFTAFSIIRMFSLTKK